MSMALNVRLRLWALCYSVLYLYVAAPFCFLACLLATLLSRWRRGEQSFLLPPGDRRTVLVTGGGLTKCLHLCRALGRAGHRVVAAEGPGVGRTVSGASRWVDR